MTKKKKEEERKKSVVELKSADNYVQPLGGPNKYGLIWPTVYTFLSRYSFTVGV